MRARLALLLLSFSAALPAQELGTLFHSPKEREALERMRRGETVEQTLVPIPDPVVTGFVKRSDGKSTVFIDKRPYRARDPRMQSVLQPGIIGTKESSTTGSSTSKDGIASARSGSGSGSGSGTQDAALSPNPQEQPRTYKNRQ